MGAEPAGDAFEPIQTAAEVFRRAGVRPQLDEEQQRIFDAVVRPDRAKADGGNVEAEAATAPRRDRPRRGDAGQRALRRQRARRRGRGRAREAGALPPGARCPRRLTGSSRSRRGRRSSASGGCTRCWPSSASRSAPSARSTSSARTASRPRRGGRPRSSRARGSSVGAYTSPHVTGWSERIQVDGEDADLEQALERVRPAAERVGATQFEVLTAAAFAEFAAAGVEVAVVEAGLGGRLDATNVLDAEVVALTNVALDHTDVLGETREAIADEKLAVVAPGATVVLGEPEWASRARARGAGRVVVSRRRRPRGGRGVPRASARGRRRRQPARPLRRGRRRRLRRRPQPGRGRVAARAAPARRLRGRRLDPRRQGRRGDAGRARPRRRHARRDRLAQRPGAAGRRAGGPRRAVLRARRDRRPTRPPRSIAGASSPGEQGAVLVTGSLYLLADLIVRLQRVPWGSSASA